MQTHITDDTKYLTLGLDRDVLGVPVGFVQEILDLRDIARLPYAPSYLIGMIDVRGVGVPVVDLRRKLGMHSIPPTSATRILVLNLPACANPPIEASTLTIGLIADRVIEVTGLDEGVLAPPPDIGVAWRSDIILGIGRRGADFVIVLDPLKLFTDTDEDILAVVPRVDAAA